MKPPILFLVLLNTLFACDRLNNRSQINRVDCGETVIEDYLYVLDSQGRRLSGDDFEVLLRSNQFQDIRSLKPTSKGCFARDRLDSRDTILVKSPKKNEVQIVYPEMINGRTPITLTALPDKKPNIVCNHNVVDSTLLLNQFVNFNDSRFLEFYNLSAAVSLEGRVVAETDENPILSSGSFDVRNLIRGKIYDLDMRIHDFVFSNGSLISMPCELDMDIPNLSAKLGDEIKEYRNYFGNKYGVVDEGYELNFYIEGGLKSVGIDFCVKRIDPEHVEAMPMDASCADLNLPIQAYASSEKGVRLDKGFWQVLYRYKKGLVTKPWISQKIMVRKICDTALYNPNELDQNFCTDIAGNLNFEGEQNTGILELKYASTLLGQLYVVGTKFNDMDLPNLEFASQIEIVSNLDLKRIRMPRLSQVSLNFNIAENMALEDISELSSLERVGSFLGLINTNLKSLAGLEKLKVVGSHLYLVNNALLTSMEELQDLKLVGGDFQIDGNSSLKTIDGLPALENVIGSLQFNNHALLESIHLRSSPQVRSAVNFTNNEKLVSLNGFTKIRSMDGLSFIGNKMLATLEAFESLRDLKSLMVSNCPLIENFRELKNLKLVTFSLTVENMSGLKSLEGLEGISRLSSIVIQNNSELIDLSGLDGLQSVVTFYVKFNAKLKSFNGLDSLAYIEHILNIYENHSLVSLAGTAMVAKKIDFITIQNNIALLDLAILKTVETTQSIQIISAFALPSLKDLGNLKTVLFDVEFNQNNGLKSFEGLALESIGRDFLIKQNIYLESLNGLNNLTSIGGNLDLDSAIKIKNLKGLESLKSVKGWVTLRSTASLTSLEGLDSLESVGGGFVFAFTDNLKEPCKFFKDPSKVKCIDRR